jgi:PIN domain nuclease of toxin-antitoxin system
LLWWDRQLRGLSRPLRAAIADEANDMFVSAGSIWELAIKRATGKLSFSRSIVDAASELGFEILPVTGSHAERAGGLPPHHNDPFDRLIIAQGTPGGDGSRHAGSAHATVWGRDARPRLIDWLVLRRIHKIHKAAPAVLEHGDDSRGVCQPPTTPVPRSPRPHGPIHLKKGQVWGHHRVGWIFV